MARERGGFDTQVRSPSRDGTPLGVSFFTRGVEMEKLCFYGLDGVTSCASSAGFEPAL